MTEGLGHDDGRSGAEAPSGSQAAPGAAEASPPPVSIPNAIVPLQPVHGFLGAMADRFQEMHRPPLDRDQAVLMAVRVLGECEDDCAPFNHPDFDWSLEGGRELADLEIEHWEKVDDLR